MKKFLLFFFISSPCFAGGLNVGGGTSSGTYTNSGYSSRFSETFSLSSVTDALNQIFNFAYSGPGISLTSSPSPEVVEDGTTISSVLLSAFTTEVSSPITVVTFYRNGTLINTVGSPPSSGGTSTYTDGSITATAAYTAKVTDNVSTTTSNTESITYVYPFFYGVGAQALTMSQIASLTKLVQTKQDITTTTSPTNQVYYFAYPQSYGSLTSIIDQNGFNTTSGYTQHSYTYAANDGSNQAYYAYEFNTPTTQTNFKKT